MIFIQKGKSVRLSRSPQRSTFKMMATTTYTRIKPLFLATLASLPTSQAFTSSMASPPLIDVDCNLSHPDLTSIGTTLQLPDDVPLPFRILHHPSTTSANIVGMIAPSSTVDESEKILTLLRSSSERDRNGIVIKTTVGVHPYHCHDAPQASELNKLRQLLDDPSSQQWISCLGETGLDYSPGFPDQKHQLSWFQSQLDLAFEYNLPLFLHERLAFEDTLRCIDEAINRHSGKDVPKIIVHCFTGSYDECIEYIARGYYISLSGYILKTGEEIDQIRKCLQDAVIPLDRLMIETDAPYMGFAGNKEEFCNAEGETFMALSSKKKKRFKSIYPNVPCVLPMVLDGVLADVNKGRALRGEEQLTFGELAKITTENSKLFFGLSV